ncbi:Endoglucanase E-4 precursor [Rhodobacteraceae bacterium THAF1]|uniref:glycoside hydrolase family 9 protein n=1 Tax=Palleronia sp. THAF1 TaxID=2587842 RepID=UPI000F3DFFEC|nr:glycoside hydrolase family 9 protein [Palleronia sp. THAF1]QFU10372.1 Endoglucanase E-4 precursor [Palleronia sp. THAF1]VDC31397.1 Endoglucanase E-4 precursor [Rhodobacteraceae bacterium THAF1]
MSNASLTLVANSTAASTEPVYAEFAVLNSWSTSYQGRFTITNESAFAIDTWSIVVTGSPLKIRDSWGSFDIEVTKIDDGLYLVEGSGRTLQPGESAFVTYTGNGSAPSDVAIVAPSPAIEDPAPVPGPVVVDAAANAEFSIAAVWDGGFNGTFDIKNTTSDTMERWSLTISSDTLVIDSAWGVRVTDLGNGLYLLEGSGYAETLEPGQGLSVGFTGTGTPPEDLTILPSEPYLVDWQESPFVGDDYAEALSLSMDFYYAQYSGDLADDHPIEWRGDSGLQDGADVGRDLTGGLYDAGDHVKFALPQAYTATVLATGALDFEDGYRASGSYNQVVEHVDWITEYLLRCYDDNGTVDISDDVFYAQVGDPIADHAYWGAPEDMTMDRPSYALTAEIPGTEVTAQAAAALASGGLLMSAAGDLDRASLLIENAEKLFTFSIEHQGTYTDAIPGVDEFYGSLSGYEDEIAWAASWLFEATGNDDYLAVAEEYYQPSATYWAMTWDNQSMATALRLAEFTGKQEYLDDLDQHFDHWIYAVDRLEGTDTNGGLAWIEEWGSNRYAANTAFLALQYADHLETLGETERANQLTDFARDQIDYILGDNPDAFSFVVGFGEDFAHQPHHRGASGTDHVGIAGDNLYQLDGALVGGPDQFGNYSDDRTDYVGNEVAIDYNAGLSGALAGLYEETMDLFVF